MSHFTVLVIGEDVEKQLEPYHEFECTGRDDQYVQDVDVTEEYRQDWQKYGKGTFAEYCATKGKRIIHSKEQINDDHKYGYTLANKTGEVATVIRRTNPNAKWDWYLVGGRWTGFFKLKKGAEGVRGRPGIMTEPAKPGYADQAHKEDIDILEMGKEASTKAGERWDEFHAIVDKHPAWASWEEIKAKHDIPKEIKVAREEYHNQPAIKAINDAGKYGFLENPEKYQVPREEYTARAAATALQTFAVVKDGKWYDRGKMGWWACVSDEKPAEQWSEEFSRLINDLAGDTLLTLVDCHI